MFKKSTCLLAVSLIVSVASFSQQITVDSSFGTNGTVSIPDISEVLYLKRITAQHDGKLIVPYTADENGYFDHGTVAKITTHGEIDETFGTGGFKQTNHGRGVNELCAVLVQPDDKILAYSSGYNRETYEDSLFLERWLPNGGYDSSFGRNGSVSLGVFGYQNPNETFMALKPDGHIVVTYLSAYDTFYTAQLKPDGSLDRSFGDKGVVKLYAADNYNNTPVGLAALPDNRIVIANQYLAGMPGVNNYYKDNLTAYQPNGNPDSSVGANGVVYISDTSYHNFMVDIRSWQNKLYVYAEGSGQDVLIRYNADGTLDHTFSTNGKVYSGTPSSDFYTDVRDFDIQPDGKIITALTGNDTYKRYFTNGVQDLSFGTDGVFTPNEKSRGTDFKIIQNRLFIAAADYSSGDYAALNVSGYKPVSSPSANAVAMSRPALHPAIGIYPNPVMNTVNISGLGEGVHHVKVITQNGNMISDVTATGINYHLDMSALANGIYFIQVMDALQSTTFKVVKQ